MADTLEINLDELKVQNKGLRTALVDERYFVVVIDMTQPIGTSKKDNEIFATTNGFQGTPWGRGIFLEMVLGQLKKWQRS